MKKNKKTKQPKLETMFAPRLKLEEQTTGAEATMVQIIAENNLSLAIADQLTAAIPKMFPDSPIAANYKCGRKKATAMVKELSALTMADLAKRMQKQPFSLATDGGNERDKAKQFPLLVTIEGSNGLVNPELLSLQACEGRSTGENIFHLLDNEFQVQGIPWKNCLALGVDNANVMTGHQKGVYAYVKKEHEEVHLARCCLHIVHNAAKAGVAHLPPIEEMMIDIFYYFKKSHLRKGELKELQELYQVEQLEMLKHVCTRWLSIGRCLQRLVDNWNPLKHFFHEETKKEKKDKTAAQKGKDGKEKDKGDEPSTSETHTNKKIAAIFEFLRSPTNLLFCQFLLYAVKKYDQVLLQLQTDAPMICCLRKNLVKLLENLYTCFLLPKATKDKDVDKVDLTATKKDADLLIGKEAKGMIKEKEKHHLRQTRIEDFYKAVKEYFSAVCAYLRKNLPLQDPVLLNAEVAAPSQQEDSTGSQLEYFLERFPCLQSHAPDDDLLDLFAQYQGMNIEVKDNERADAFWTRLGKEHKELAPLATTMKGILCIPNSNAPCERLFSMLRKNVTEQRASLQQDTTEALMVVKAIPGSCLDLERQLSSETLGMLKNAHYKRNQIMK